VASVSAFAALTGAMAGAAVLHHSGTAAADATASGSTAAPTTGATADQSTTDQSTTDQLTTDATAPSSPDQWTATPGTSTNVVQTTTQSSGS
jgi:hypothetical protein